MALLALLLSQVLCSVHTTTSLGVLLTFLHIAVTGLAQNRSYDLRVQAGLDGIFAPIGASISFETEEGSDISTTTTEASLTTVTSDSTTKTSSGTDTTASSNIQPTTAGVSTDGLTTSGGLAGGGESRGGTKSDVPIAAIIAPIAVVVLIVLLVLLLRRRSNSGSNPSMKDPGTTQVFMNELYANGSLTTQAVGESEYDNMDSALMQPRSLTNQNLGRKESAISIDI
jgi:uncharacterized membrane protein